MRIVFARLERPDLKALIFLGFVALCLHAHGLGLGFWFDDNNHLELCHKNGYAGLAADNTFDWNQRIAHVWWATRETGWAYFRPLTVAIRTLELNLLGLNAVLFHIVYLAIYIISVLLFYSVIRRWGGSVGMALTAGLLFTIHPSHSMAAAWLACDGPVLVGVWTFAALWLLRTSVEVNHRCAAPLAGLFLCYALAMLSRESGVMLGPMLVIGDWFAARQNRGGQQKTIPAHNATAASNPMRWFFRAGLAVEAVIFLLVRSHSLQGLPVPRSPYFTSPWEPGFSSWIFHKSLSDFLCLTLGLPSFPVVNIAWMQERLATTLALTFLATAVAALFLYPLRRLRAAWAILAGMALAAAPTLLMISANYHYYMISAGWAALLAMWADQLRLRHPRLVRVMLTAVSVTYLISLWSGAWVLHASATLEHTVRDSVLATDPAKYPLDTRIFFINLPLTSMEAGPAIRLASNRPDLDFCPLTLSPGPFAPARTVTYKKESKNTLLVKIEGSGWFSGRFGEQVGLGWFGASRRDFKVGSVQISPVAGSLPFRVEIVQADSEGIKALRFIFDKPISDPSYRFFVGTSDVCAQPLSFTVDGYEVPASPPTLHEKQLMQHLRRMQIAYDSVVKLLVRCP